MALLTHEDTVKILGGLKKGSAIAASVTPISVQTERGQVTIPQFSGSAGIHVSGTKSVETLNTTDASVYPFYEFMAIDVSWSEKFGTLFSAGVAEKAGYNIGKKIDEQIIAGAVTLSGFDNWSALTAEEIAIVGETPTANEIITALQAAATTLGAAGFSANSILVSNAGAATLQFATNAAGATPFLGTIPGYGLHVTDATVNALTMYIYDNSAQALVLGTMKERIYKDADDGFAGQYDADLVKLVQGVGYKSLKDSVVKLKFVQAVEEEEPVVPEG